LKWMNGARRKKAGKEAAGRESAPWQSEMRGGGGGVVRRVWAKLWRKGEAKKWSWNADGEGWEKVVY